VKAHRSSPCHGLVVTTTLLLATLLVGCEAAPGSGKPASSPRASAPPVVESVFRDNMIHFAPEDSARYETVQVWSEDRGRVIAADAELRLPRGRILARVTTRPIPKDLETVYDKWDRAANVQVAAPGRPDVELVKFITAYGGETTHEIDVTDLAPFLTGHVVWKGFIDTWVTPAWRMDFELEVDPDSTVVVPGWGQALFFEPLVTAELLASGPLTATAVIPEGLARVELRYLVSGHCTDGTDADEFQTKDNVVAVDGTEVARFRPWRDDCRQFRAVNPYCRRWSDGSWSSDYDRSGWCPGDAVAPLSFDLTSSLPPGEHAVTVTVENVRPRDENGNFGYWRISAYLLGWRAATPR